MFGMMRMAKYFSSLCETSPHAPRVAAGCGDVGRTLSLAGILVFSACCRASDARVFRGVTFINAKASCALTPAVPQQPR